MFIYFSLQYFPPDVPHCRPDQVQVYGVARYETVRISCEVNIKIAIMNDKY